ncbi:putative endoIII-related endonuclease [Halovivax ruber XH-70]|uniref:Putative endoIII-related endonuclease n=1 Tax=Halovivax ruber (strain DSM 18193 / JCM 13892 / XH-70) TaxID=797302 RepID=L0ICF2_HALRX|nr:endonuclease III [Halovivax ruber]AGB16503.1 putative endoIII-related endonuclease [Halovivax ruber XH-70]
MSEESDGDPADADEPTVNISGGASGGGAAATFDPGTADSRAERVVDRLGELYWQKTYGGQDAFTCLVRTILSQNTSDVASQPAHDALIERYGPDGGEADENGHEGATDGETESTSDLAATLADADREEIAETISAAGLYNQKSRMIQEAAEWVRTEFGTAPAFDAYVRETAPATVRDELLSVHGVGPKTADCVLLFAGGQDGVYPVDTHVHRISRRLGIAPPEAGHEGVREALETTVPGPKCGFGHTAMIQFGREYCTARKPACLDGTEACPLAGECDRVGVDIEAQSVVDPAEAD